MIDCYRTVAGYGCREIEIQRSRFIAYVTRAEREEEALAFIAKLRKEHWDATHNCVAYIIGERDELQKADDDGEPSGTAGRPMLEVLKKQALKDTLVVVTRYFGGIKLGAGGLVRAYGQAVVEGIKESGLIERRLHTQLAVRCDYSLLGTLENQLGLHGYSISQREFDDAVNLIVLAPSGEEEKVESKLLDWTAARVELSRLGQQYVDTVLAT
ncbi:YigZ family protein [Azotosporobacter soli]|uniref:YigZ family protein n=1 Tax=Azotosporobacter soli TaxID=3055040 RepID=UPI0031FF2C1E